MSLADLVKQQNSIELKIFEYSLSVLKPLYESRREFVATEPRFWPTVLEASELLAEYITYEDTGAIDALRDIHLEWDPENVKNITISLKFDDNPYFGATTLTKKFVYNQDDEYYTSEKVSVPWKKGKSLLEKQPGRDRSFFSWFEYEGSSTDTEGSEVAQIISEELYPHALKIYQDAQEQGIEEEYDLSDEVSE